MCIKRTKKASPPSSLLESLPDDVAISCLSRVSRMDMAALSVMSKSCRSLVASSELYETRSVMGYAEKYPYICLIMPPDPHPRWFILRPTLDAATGKTVKRAHAIPSCPSQPPEGSAVVALDWGIYVLGGLVKGKPTSGVLLLDCRSHTWHHVTPMRVARASPAARVVDGKIYVLGGCKDDWGEVFDPKTQTWAALPILDKDTATRPTMSCIHGSVLIQDKVYVMDIWNRRSFFYSPSLCKWGLSNQHTDGTAPIKREWCVIDNLVYACGQDGRIYWCEPGDLDRCDALRVAWSLVDGVSLQVLQEYFRESRLAHFGEEMASVLESYLMKHNISKKVEDLFPGAKLTNFGRNMLLFWDVLEGRRGNKTSQIWCAEISFHSGRYNLCGRVEWSSAILHPLLHRSKLLYSISVDV